MSSKEIILIIDSTDVLINGVKTQIDCAPVIVPSGRTFLPLRFISETKITVTIKQKNVMIESVLLLCHMISILIILFNTAI